MSNGWPTVALGEVATPVERPTTPVPGVAYRQIGVRLWGEGAYERETIDGSQTKYATLSRVEEGDIIVNKIWARNGSVSTVTPDLAGGYVSGEFPTFAPMSGKLDPQWFRWLTKTRPFWDQCDEKSRGTSGQNRIRPERFLEIVIPLPPLAEQRRIVARIEALAARIAEARGLRQQAMEEAEVLTTGVLERVLRDTSGVELPLGSVLREDSLNGIGIYPSDTPPGVPILRISAGTSRSDGVVDESDFRYLEASEESIAKYRLFPGDLLACRFNGNLRFVGRFSLYQGYSNRVHVYPDKLIRFRVDTAKVLPEYVRLAMNSPQGREAIESFCATTAGNIGISAGKLKTVRILVPSAPEQRRIVAYLDDLQAQVDALKRLQAETAAELDALLPSILDKAFKGEL